MNKLGNLKIIILQSRKKIKQQKIKLRIGFI